MSAVPPRSVALALAAVIVALAVLGIGFERSRHGALLPFDLDGEWNVPALFSALLLLVAAAMLLGVPATISARRPAVVFAGFLFIAALDEAVQIHERLERRLEIDWQLLYLPGIVVALVIWGLLLLALRHSWLSAALVFAAGIAWCASQVLEHEQWEVDQPVPGYARLMVLEELLELTGSALLIVALLLVPSMAGSGAPAE